MLRLPVYMDNHATTRTDPRVVEAMLPFFTEKYGNPASRTHVFGWEAEEAVKQARQAVAALIGAGPREIIFTSGATESNNLALKGVAWAYRERGNHIVSVVTEHPSVLDPLKRLEQEGFRVTLLPVDRDGLISSDQVVDALTPQTILVSVMAANNEIGVLQPLEAIGKVCKERGVLFHTDATQAVGKIPLDVEALGVDLLSLSAHKFYGPKGVGALYVRKRNPYVRLMPLLDGGGHEQGLRSGTLPTPLIVGLGRACELAQAEMHDEAERVRSLRDRLWQGLSSRLDEVILNGHPTRRLPGNLNVSFRYIRADALLVSLRNLAVSSGSACTSAEVRPSHVLLALGLEEDLAHASVRFGIGRFNTEEEVDWAIEYVAEAVTKLRRMNPLYQMAHATPVEREA
ncbi:MAG: IscS subfamily cysteine desulfurase [Gemmatales bacterium]|nr:IscS subfamily cysteine desulfurase [Gemmatales bacterium]MDW8386555.1 IscS subfamily cysteine desulfurase [Gemmatales bacterium]